MAPIADARLQDVQVMEEALPARQHRHTCDKSRLDCSPGFQVKVFQIFEGALCWLGGVTEKFRGEGGLSLLGGLVTCFSASLAPLVSPVGARNASASQQKNNPLSTVWKTFTWKPRQKYVLDCLICAIFAVLICHTLSPDDIGHRV